MNMPAQQTQPVYTQTKTTSKRYFAKVAHSRFICPDGTEIIFAFGKADVDILEHQQELDKILGKNPNIYIPDVLPETPPVVPQNAKSEKEIAETERAIANGGVATVISGETNDGPTGLFGSPGDVTNLDPEIQAAMNNQAQTGNAVVPGMHVGPGAASRVEQLRRAAAERQPVQELPSEQTAAAPSISPK